MKIYAMLVAIFILLSGTVSANNSSTLRTDIPISVTINDNYIKMDSKPFLYANSTYVPIRFVSQALGADQVSWDEQSDTATVKYDGNIIILPVGKTYAIVNGVKTSITNGIRTMGDRTYVPIRFVSETMGANVEWEPDYYNVKISKAANVVPQDLIENKSYTKDDVYWMSRIINAESAGEPMAGKIAVGNVVLNRVKSSDYPDSIHEVIFESNQFEPVLNGTINNKPSQDSVIAALRSLEGENVIGNSLFFFNPTIASSNWISRNRTYDTTIGNHEFYL